jgi:hypothetical protein
MMSFGISVSLDVTESRLAVPMTASLGRGWEFLLKAGLTLEN